MELAPVSLTSPSESRPAPVAPRWPEHPAASGRVARFAAACARWARSAFTPGRRATATPDHPAAVGASDRELARLDQAGWTVDDARTDSMKRLGGYRRPAL